MTGKADFTQDEWKLVLEAPPSAGLIVVTAQKGGTFRETIAIAKAYAEARQEHGESELLDEITAAKPERDHTHYHSPDGAQAGRSAAPARRGSSARDEGHPGRGRRLPALHPDAGRQGRRRSPRARAERQRRRAAGDRRDRHGVGRRRQLAGARSPGDRAVVVGEGAGRPVGADQREAHGLTCGLLDGAGAAKEVEVGAGEAGAGRVHLDAVGFEIGGERDRERVERGFGG